MGRVVKGFFPIYPPSAVVVWRRNIFPVYTPLLLTLRRRSLLSLRAHLPTAHPFHDRSRRSRNVPSAGRGVRSHNRKCPTPSRPRTPFWSNEITAAATMLIIVSVVATAAIYSPHMSRVRSSIPTLDVSSENRKYAFPKFRLGVLSFGARTLRYEHTDFYFFVSLEVHAFYNVLLLLLLCRVFYVCLMSYLFLNNVYNLCILLKYYIMYLHMVCLCFIP